MITEDNNHEQERVSIWKPYTGDYGFNFRSLALYAPIAILIATLFCGTMVWYAFNNPGYYASQIEAKQSEIRTLESNIQSAQELLPKLTTDEKIEELNARIEDTQANLDSARIKLAEFQEKLAAAQAAAEREKILEDEGKMIKDVFRNNNDQTVEAAESE